MENEQQLFINAAREMLPQYNDQMSDEQILEVYDEIKAKLPGEDMQGIIDIGKQMIPEIVQGMEEKMGKGAPDAPNKLDALRNINNGGM